MEEKRAYSGLFIISPDKEDAADAVENDIKSIINENSGNVVGEKKIGKKHLACPMKKKKDGVYYEVAFNALPSAIERITRLCRINTDILRTLIDRVK